MEEGMEKGMEEGMEEGRIERGRGGGGWIGGFLAWCSHKGGCREDRR